MSERYNRQLILHGFGVKAQRLLTKAKVLVIGAGGLGCPALQYLAAAGIGHIGIADHDIITLSNLHRQILFTTADLGKLKAEVSAQRLRDMNPEIEIVPLAVRLQSQNILAVMKGYDIILDGTDNFESRYLINDACALLSKPLVFAAVSGYEGQLAIFNVNDEKGERTNYRDLFPVPPQAGEVANCAENGVLGVLPGVIGTMAAAEIIKMITGIGRPLINRLLHYNLLNTGQYEMSISTGRDYNLPATEDEFTSTEYQHSCKIPGCYIEIDAFELMALRKQSSTLLIDVREKHELPVLNSEVFTGVPMSEFAGFLEADTPAKNIVLICQHGIRSAAAAEELHEKYGDRKRIYSLKGGIVKWQDHLLKI